MKKFNFIKTLLIILIVTFQSKPQILFNVRYASEDTLFAAGWDVFSLYKSTNAGESWFPMNFGQNTDLLSLEFISPLVGYTSIGANIWMTSDGGTSWDFVTTGNPIAVLDISFFDSQLGLGDGPAGKIAKSTDAGQSWQLLTSGTDKHLLNITFIDQNTAITVGGEFTGDEGVILRTTNGGTSWEFQFPPTQKTLRSVSLAGENTVFAVGFSGAIIKSTDSGNTWSLQDSLTSNILNSCDFVSQEIGFAVGSSGTILKTTNGGQNWEFINSATSQTLSSIKMRNELTGVVVGTGIFLKTTDGGNSWIPKQIMTGVSQYNNHEINSYKLMQNYPNPFNPSTTIRFTISDLPAGRQGLRFTTLKVYDVLGNEIATLVNEEKPAGEYTVEFSSIGGSASGGSTFALPSGIYFYQLKSGDPSSSSGQDYVETKKMVLLK
jgi:photosystem II stability/assembly factor-like uncharacterized protein